MQSLSIHDLPKTFPHEMLYSAGFALYPIKADQASKELLGLWQNATVEREAISERLMRGLRDRKWVTDAEMQVHREKSGDVPREWDELLSAIRREYTRFAQELYGTIQRKARTIQGCDESRIDMLRHAVCLLKYYGVLCENGSCKTVDGKYLGYNLLNPTWDHLEDEVRNDVGATGPRYPDSPIVAPTPAKTGPGQYSGIFHSMWDLDKDANFF